MMQKKSSSNNVKSKFHARNKNKERYNFEKLVAVNPVLAEFIQPNIHNEDTIDFKNTEAVKALNSSLLKLNYNLQNWHIPAPYLCPPIRERADYIHYIADLLCAQNFGKTPKGAAIKGLDIGVGASLIYPIIGTLEYGWSFIGADTDANALQVANTIIAENEILTNKIECRLQNNPKDFYYGIIGKDEPFDFAICNPPILNSNPEKHEKNKSTPPAINLMLEHNKLYYDGGEMRFVKNMVNQSKKFAQSCFLFSTIITKQSTANVIYEILENSQATIIETILLGSGYKASRIVAWSFLSKEAQRKWKQTRWKEA